MRLVKILKSFLGIHNDDATQRAAVIMKLSDESVEAAQSLNEQLKVYTRDDDPFNAMVIDLINKRALTMSRK